jgi:hypothetical protein
MSDTIFVDPEVANAAVIDVGGICYRRLGESNQPPTVTAVGSAYGSCSHCDDPPEPGICDVTAFNTGQEEDNDRDQKWRVNGSPAYVVSQSAWVSPAKPDSDWISHDEEGVADAAADEDDG